MITPHRRLIGIASLGLASALALSACAPSEPAGPEASGSLTIWTEDYYVAIFEPLVQSWADENGIDVTFVTKDFTAMGDQFVTAVPAGEGPDIFISPSTTSKFVTNGVVAPVELGDAADLFAPISMSAFTKDGSVYGVPFTIENIALYRNPDLAPESPATLDDAFAEGQALVAAGTAKTAFAIGLDPTAGNPYLMMPLQTSFGSQIFAQDSDGNFDPDQLVLDDAAGVKFAESLAEWGTSGALNADLTGDIALEQFKNGETPFFLSGPWDLAGVKESGVPYVIDTIPSAGGETAAPFVGFYGVYQSPQAKNPVAASLFLTDFMTRTDTQVGIWKSAQNPPALISALDEVSSDPDMQAFGEVGKNAVRTPEISAMDQVWGPWGETEMQILRGQVSDPAQAWKDMAEKIRTAIAAG